MGYRTDPARPLAVLAVVTPGRTSRSAAAVSSLAANRRVDLKLASLRNRSTGSIGPSGALPSRVRGGGPPGASVVRDASLIRRAVREHQPDVIVATDRASVVAALPVAYVTGRHLVLMDDGQIDETSPLRRLVTGVIEASASDEPSAPDQAVDRLSVIARRPGAGRFPDVAMTVAITVFNESARVKELVATLSRQMGPRDEFVIVDGGSTDGTWETLTALTASDSRFKAIRRAGAGISAGRNEAIRQATNHWIAVTDAGCHPDPSWLDAFKRAAAVGEAELLTGLYQVVPTRPVRWQRAMAAALYPSIAEVRRPDFCARLYGAAFGTRFRANLPTGRSVAFTRAAWEAAGGYPEHLATAEDVLFGVYAVEAGVRASLVTDAVVAWVQRDTLRANFKMYFSYGVGGGESGSALLLGRHLVRAFAYLAGPALVLRGGRGRVACIVGAAAYYSIPIRRSSRRNEGLATAALVPFVMAVKDAAEASGAVRGLVSRARTGARGPAGHTRTDDADG